jgi:fumarylacetoacetase
VFLAARPAVMRGTWRGTWPRDGGVLDGRSGSQAVDLGELVHSGALPAHEPWAKALTHSNLDELMAMERPAWRAARFAIQALFLADCAVLRDNAELRAKAMIPLKDVTPVLPCTIGDYTDFYSSREHATNVGTMFRGKDNALQPNWLHLPVGYHGRASTIVPHGVPLHRPHGQLEKNPADPKEGSVFGTCRLMDFELEIGAFYGGKANPMGTPVRIDRAWDHIFGLVLMNDWSARDIQKWEYVPLGPFTAKNVGTSISTWIVSLDALEPFRCPTSAGKQTDPEPLPYLRDPQYSSFNIQLHVALQNETDCPEPVVITKSNFAHMYWTPAQQLTHHSVTGCSMRPGDLLGSGTISGDHDKAYGSMLELSWRGSKPVVLGEGVERKFLKDGDDVIMTGFCEGEGFRVGLGECSGRLLPAIPLEAFEPPAEAAAASATSSSSSSA